jgi:uncharacterized protein
VRVVQLFVEPRSRRLRAGWRIVVTILLVALSVIALSVLASLLWNLLAQGAPMGPSASLVATGVVTLLGVTLAIWLAGRWIDRRPFAGFGFQLGAAWWIDLSFGFVVGALAMTLIFLVGWAAGWTEVTGVFQDGAGTGSLLLALLPPFLFFICVGIYEELLVRGYLLLNMSEGFNFAFLGPRAAIILAWMLSSALFGLLHLMNPNSSILSSVNISVAGLLLGLGYVLTGQLAIPIGIHISWNFFQGHVFGFPVSGTPPFGATVLETADSGPALWTGGAFGPEGGLIVLPALLFAAGAILLWVRARGGKAGFHPPLAEPPGEATRPAGQR